MALQGALETITLDEVLRLLASGHKTGRLTLAGGLGTGELWVIDGRLAQATVEVDTTSVGDDADVLFHLLRFADGEFVFADDLTLEEPPEHTGDLHELLAEGASRLAEWHEIGAVVTGLDVSVALVERIDEVATIEPDEWQWLVAIASGTSVRSLGERFALCELDTLRAVRDLMERSLVETRETAEQPSAPLETIDAADPIESVTVVAAEPADAEPTAAVEAEPASSADVEATPASAQVDPPLGEDAAPDDTGPTAGVPESWRTAAPPEAFDDGHDADPTADQEAGEADDTALAWVDGAESEADAGTPAVVAPVEWDPPAAAPVTAETAHWTPSAAPAAAPPPPPPPPPPAAGPVDQETAPGAQGVPATAPAPAAAVRHDWDPPSGSTPSDDGHRPEAGDDSDSEALWPGRTGAIEYGDDIFDQAAEALGWSQDVDASPEGFWREAALRPDPPEPTPVPAGEAADMARQLAALSPGAARAVALAAQADTAEARDAALAQAEAEDPSVDRGLLLRFLGTFET